MYAVRMCADAIDPSAGEEPEPENHDRCTTGPGNSAGCCSLMTGPLDVAEAKRLAARLRALSDPTRLRLLSHIASRDCEPTCTCDLTAELGVSQPTISHHAKRLVDAGLLSREQHGRWAHYTVVTEAFSELRDLLDLG